jgi:hypothetical protein
MFIRIRYFSQEMYDIKKFFINKISPVFPSVVFLLLPVTFLNAVLSKFKHGETKNNKLFSPKTIFGIKSTDMYV